MTTDKVTVLDFRKKMATGRSMTMLTAYDCPMARLIDEAGIDAVLVGDSVGMVVLGYESTINVTMDEMIHHAAAARRGVRRAFLIGDMPFMSYQASDEDAVRNAGRFVKEAGCEAVKVEGGSEIVPRVKAIIDAGIPVLGHLGLTPQSLNRLGKYRVQGTDAASAARIEQDAARLEEAGCFALILECVPAALSDRITAGAGIPTIGIGAGKGCDGQVLVTYDMIGYFDKFTPRFVKQYANISPVIKEAIGRFREEVSSGEFPGEEHTF
jgi:3-methyl-2-oxobutanoate hydroxymethyltransferase